MENLLINYQTGILFLVSYLVGSIPFGYLIFKLKNDSDIRNYGSGNIGATNVNRLLGKKLGFLTLLLDVCKTLIVSYIFFNYFGSDIGSICGAFSIIGHIFPLWLNFRGGKGVASFLGLLSIVSWPLGIVFCFIWTLSVKIFKYSGAGAIIAIIINILIFKLVLDIQFNYKILYWVPGTYFEYNVILFLSFIILIKHYKNFISFFKK